MARRLTGWLWSQWRLVLLAAYVGVNLVLISDRIALDPSVPVDWQMWSALPAAIDSGTVYDVRVDSIPFVWSPVAAWLMAGVVAIGYWPWVALHVAAVIVLRDWRMIVLVLGSVAFWFDTAQGNTLTFAIVAGMLALRGSRVASLIYLGILLLMPRPLMAPLAVWLLWQDRSLWKPAAMMFTVHAALVVASGYAMEWIPALVAADVPPGLTLGPTAWFGKWWLLVGIPTGIWLTATGRLGWAGLAISPFVVPQYLMWPLLEVGWGAPRRSINLSSRIDGSFLSGHQRSHPAE
jgi:hypothetical protein